jgi:hypothetical protein
MSSKTRNRFTLIPPDYSSLRTKYNELYTLYTALKMDYMGYINEDDEKAKRSTYFRLRKDERDFLAKLDPNHENNMTRGLRFILQKEMFIDRMIEQKEGDTA